MPILVNPGGAIIFKTPPVCGPEAAKGDVGAAAGVEVLAAVCAGAEVAAGAEVLAGAGADVVEGALEQPPRTKAIVKIMDRITKQVLPNFIPPQIFCSVAFDYVTCLIRIK